MSRNRLLLITVFIYRVVGAGVRIANSVLIDKIFSFCTAAMEFNVIRIREAMRSRMLLIFPKIIYNGFGFYDDISKKIWQLGVSIFAIFSAVCSQI